MKRLIINLAGAVQGVGFRPFVYRTAKELDLRGFVLNNTSGVIIEVEGSPDNLNVFLLRLNSERPPLSHIFSQDITYRETAGYKGFEIRESSGEGKKDAIVLPDISTCSRCFAELFNPVDRRFLYPFINCTNCGPRFTITKKLPYDRPNTTMEGFMLCPQCQREYESPDDRRFHAQPNACPVCGPCAGLYTNNGTLISEGKEAVAGLVNEIRRGSIVALKGIGGFHLVCDARNSEAIRLLRERKRRQEKPFAVMFPDICSIKEHALVSAIEEALLLSPESPVVLVKKKKDSLPPLIAPGLKTIGAFLPYSPLHHIILRDTGFPVVATSGNISDEPVVKDNDDALHKLSRFTDFMLVHNRPIQARCDDSVVKAIAGFPAFIRRSRGYSPMPVRLPFRLKRRVLAAGGFYKNTFAIGSGDRVILSQHIGDIETVDAIGYFNEAVRHICGLYEFSPDIIVHDLHPGYETTRWAASQASVQRIGVQHHFAHILSCMAENGIDGDVFGVAWDGTGYGEDGQLWGGEFMRCSYASYEKTASFRPLRLLGGEKAIKEPRRVALSILFEIFGAECLAFDMPVIKSFNERELEVLLTAWGKGINSPYSSSAGRLFDAAASFLNIKQVLDYEGQAAMMLEDLYDPHVSGSYPWSMKDGSVDWSGMFLGIVKEREKDKAASRFINTLAEIILHAAQEAGLEKVCISGGVFQNAPLADRVMEILSGEFRVFANRKVPPNDGGLSLGQAVYGGLKEL